MKKHIEYLRSLNACKKVVTYADQFDSLQAAWDVCERGDWMLWLLGKQAGEISSDSRKHLVWIACQCARLTLKYVPEGEARPLRAIETAEAYTRSEMTLDQVKKAAAAAAYAAAAYTASAYTAAYAAYTAAAYTAAYTAAAAADDARYYTLKLCADIIRANYAQVEIQCDTPEELA